MNAKVKDAIAVTKHVTFPVWVFARAAAADGDGTLWFNNFGGGPHLTRRQRIEVEAVLDRLRREIRAGKIPRGRAVVGWGGVAGVRPSHAVDTGDRAAMESWFNRAFVTILSGDELSDPAAASAVDVKGRRHG
jgi:hypothetical protein